MVVSFCLSYILNMNDCSLFVFIYTESEWLLGLCFHRYWIRLLGLCFHIYWTRMVVRNVFSYILNKNDCSHCVFIYTEQEWLLGMCFHRYWIRLLGLCFHIYWTRMIVRIGFSYILNKNDCSHWVFIYTEQEWLFALGFHIYWTRMIVRFVFS